MAANLISSIEVAPSSDHLANNRFSDDKREYCYQRCPINHYLPIHAATPISS